MNIMKAIPAYVVSANAIGMRYCLWPRGTAYQLMSVSLVIILWNTVTSPETDSNRKNSVKTKLYNTPSPILHCISYLSDNNGGQGYWVSQNNLNKGGLPN